MEGKVSSPLWPTEDVEKVCAAIINLFPDACLDIGEATIHGTFSDTSLLRRKIEDQQIRDTARQVLKGLNGEEKLEFHLNKQAAFVSKVNFTDGNSVLGDITVSFDSPDIQSIINGMAPRGSDV